jgi:heterogeneous nuclear ribonucleoprotein R
MSNTCIRELTLGSLKNAGQVLEVSMARPLADKKLDHSHRPGGGPNYPLPPFGGDYMENPYGAYSGDGVVAEPAAGGASKDMDKEGAGNGPKDEEGKRKWEELLALPPHDSEIFIGGLPRDITEEDLRELCEPSGEIFEVSRCFKE